MLNCVLHSTEELSACHGGGFFEDIWTFVYMDEITAVARMHASIRIVKKRLEMKGQCFWSVASADMQKVVDGTIADIMILDRSCPK